MVNNAKRIISPQWTAWMSWHFLQEGEAASWQHACLDGAPSALLKLIPVRGKSSLTDSVTKCSKSFQSGTMSQHLTGNHGEVQSMLLQEDSPARTLVSAEQEQELAGVDLVCGWSKKGSFSKLSPDLLSWKTRQCSLLADSEQSLEIWPEWGSMQDGECSELLPLERRITEQGFTWLLTPTAQSWRAWTFRNPLSLIRKNHADGNLQEQLMRLYQRMTTPRCQEILMFWPEGWTDSKPLEMDGFRLWLQEQQKYC